MAHKKTPYDIPPYQRTSMSAQRARNKPYGLRPHLMKRITVISLSVLIGFVAGLAVPAHAEFKAADASGEYICGNTGLTVQIQISEKPELFAGHIAHKTLVSAQDEAGNVLFSGKEYIDLNNGGGNAGAKSRKVVILVDEKTVSVIDNKKNKELYICSHF